MECPRCGNILDESETSCKNCGTKIERTLPEEEQPVEEVPVAQPLPEENFAQPEEYEYDQDYTYEQNSSNQKAGGNNLLVLVIVFIGVIGIFSGFMLIKNSKASGTVAIRNNQMDSSKKSEEPGEQKISEATKIEISGFEFIFPANYETAFEDGMGVSIDYRNEVRLQYMVKRDKSYSAIVASAASLNSELEAFKFQIDSYKEYTYGERNWLIFTGTLKIDKETEYDSIYAVTYLDDNISTFQVMILNAGTKSRNKLLTEIGAIVDDAKYVGKSSGDSSGGNSGGQPSIGGGGSGNGSGGTGSVSA